MIGTALCEELQNSGVETVGLDVKMKTYTGDLSRHTFHLVDLTKPIPEWVDGEYDMMIHLAAIARVYKTVLNPQLSLDNIAMTVNALEFARRNNIPKFIFASSRETYGNQEHLPVVEETASQRLSESPYTVSKISGEAYCYAYSHCYGIDTKIVRFSNAYGRYDESDRFIPKVIRRMSQDKDITIYGKEKTLSFTYLDDVISGIKTLLLNWDIAPKELNIANDSQDTLVKVAELIKEQLPSKSLITYGENQIGEVWKYQADVSKLRALGWSPKFDTHTGILHAISWYRQNL